MQLLPGAPVAPAPKKNTEEQSGPWQSKAKQALLVHTAPVHSPDKRSLPFASGTTRAHPLLGTGAPPASGSSYDIRAEPTPPCAAVHGGAEEAPNGKSGGK